MRSRAAASATSTSPTWGPPASAGVHQVVLPAAAQGGARRRRARQRRRQRLAHAHRAAAPHAARRRLRRAPTTRPSPYPDGVFIGPMAAILNETSSSDGDIFPYMFREAGLGPLIGRRSWGGVVGISPRGPLIDGGTRLRAAVGPGEREGRVGDRGLRRRSRHRRGERPEVGHRGQGPATRARRRRGDEEAADTCGAAEEASAPGEGREAVKR